MVRSEMWRVLVTSIFLQVALSVCVMNSESLSAVVYIYGSPEMRHRQLKSCPWQLLFWSIEANFHEDGLICLVPQIFHGTLLSYIDTASQ